jgi:hypothetical protein
VIKVFDELFDMEIDTTALGITVVVGIMMFAVLVFDVVNVGMDAIPLGTRVIASIICVIVCYFLVLKLINR